MARRSSLFGSMRAMRPGGRAAAGGRGALFGKSRGMGPGARAGAKAGKGLAAARSGAARPRFGGGGRAMRAGMRKAGY